MEEVWHPVVGWEGVYEVSNQGGVRSVTRTIKNPRGSGLRRLRGRPLALAFSSKGYLMVHLCRNGTRTAKSVHVLVAEAFIGPRSLGPQVMHANAVKTDNRVSNLRYGTQSDNEKDKYAVGTSCRGTRNRTARLKDADVVRIRERLAAGESNLSIAREYGLGAPTVSDIKTRRTWGWLTPIV